MHIVFGWSVQIFNCGLHIDLRSLKVHAEFVYADFLVLVEVHGIVDIPKVWLIQSINMNALPAAIDEFVSAEHSVAVDVEFDKKRFHSDLHLCKVLVDLI